MEKIYKIWDSRENREVFEGTFEEYKKQVVKNWEDTKEDLTEKEIERTGFNEDFQKVIELIETENDFVELFDRLEFYNLNAFGECVDLEIRDENGEFIYKR